MTRLVKEFKGGLPNPMDMVVNFFGLSNPRDCSSNLNEFTTLLGNEKEEEYGGVKLMEACLKEFQNEENSSDLKNKTVVDFENFIFTHNRHVYITQEQKHSRKSSTTSENLDTSKVQDRLVADLKTTIKQGKKVFVSSVMCGICMQEQNHPSKSTTCKNLETLKVQDRPRANKSIIEPVADATMKKKIQHPADQVRSTRKLVKQPPNPKTLKVKIYMGTGWEKDFPNLRKRLYVNLKINDGNSKKTKVLKDKNIPSWGEEFEFPLSNLKDAKLNIEVYDSHEIRRDKFAGKFSHWCLN